MIIFRLAPLAFAAALPAAANLVQNGDFTAGTTHWSLRLAPEATASLVDSDGEGSVLIVNGGSSRWTVNLEQVLAAPFRQGSTYAISFDVRADMPKRIDAVLRNPAGKIIGSSYGITVSPQRTHETFTYRHKDPDTPVRLVFRLGGENTAVVIDNVVAEVAPDAAPTPSTPSPATTP